MTPPSPHRWMIGKDLLRHSDTRPLPPETPTQHEYQHRLHTADLRARLRAVEADVLQARAAQERSEMRLLDSATE